MSTLQPLTAFLKQSDEFRTACATIYTPLDVAKSQIRLVHIQPAAAENKEIHLTLEVVSLDDNPTYQAISYTWGVRSPMAQIYLHNHAYNVTPSQFEALRRFRKADLARTVWMDVVCINQDDVTEKSSQVSMMSRIYSLSQQTQIWLGEIDVECTQGFTDEQWSAVQTWFWNRRGRREITALVARCHETENLSHRAQLTSAFKASTRRPEGLVYGAIHILKLLGTGVHYYYLPSLYLDSEREAQMYRPWFESMEVLKAILQKPYWRRVWTIQEAILSPVDARVHIGKHETSLSHFLALGKSALEHVGTSGGCCITMDDLIAYQHDPLGADSFFIIAERCARLSLFLRRLRSRKLRFDMALQLSDRMEAFDARDYVYGVLGFVSPDLGHIVDYSMSTSKVFQQATFLCWASQGSLNSLKHGSLDREGRMLGLPSWCMDFTDSTNSDALSFQQYESFYNGEKPNWDKLKVDFAIGQVVLEGLPIGAIQLRFERFSQPDSKPTETNLEIVTHWTSQIKESRLESNIELDPQTNKSFFRRFFDIIFRDTIFDPTNGNAQSRRLTETDWVEVEYWWEVSSQGASVANWDQKRQSAAISRIQNLSVAFCTGIYDSTLAVTTDNQLLIVPLLAKPGDRLFHIAGCCAPLVLREVEIGQGQIDAGLAAACFDPDKGKSAKPTMRTYCIVGPCYIKGFMGSQGTQDLKPETIALL